jgi:hypothetical protein
VSAGWRVLLIEVAFLTTVWLISVSIMTAHPAALLAFWGPDVSWSTVATISLGAIALFKVALWLQAALLLWAWMWASRLRKRSAIDAQRRIPSTSASEPDRGSVTGPAAAH